MGNVCLTVCRFCFCHFKLAEFTTFPGRGTKYCNQHVCLSACISQKPYIQTSQNCMYLSPVAVAECYSATATG